MSNRIPLFLALSLSLSFTLACQGPPAQVLADKPPSDDTGTTDATTTGGTGGTTDTGGSGGTTDTTGGTSDTTGGDGAGATGGTDSSTTSVDTTAAGATLAASLMSTTEIIAQLSAIGDLQRARSETKDQQIVSALKRVKAYRMLAGLRTDVTIDADDAALADAAADICMQLGMLTHTPTQPTGMSAAQYALARQGAGESNLASGFPSITIPQSIGFYMDDSDSYNIDRVGHRRWIMSPLLTQIGFGLSSDRQYSATHVFPDSAHMSACFSDPAELQPWEFILYPRWGYMPIEYVASSDVAWSVSLRGDKYNADNVTSAGISVRPADQSNNATGTALSIGYFNRSTDNYGCQHPVLIFRPTGVNLSAGQRYRVTITGITDLSGNAVPLDYWVEFFSAGVTTIP